MFLALLGHLSFGIGVMGVLVITVGTIHTFIELLKLEVKKLRGGNICPQRELIRHHFGSYILLGLEFLIAADIIDTISQPGLEEIAILGAIVAIRTVLSIFLNKEMQNHTCNLE